MRKKLIVLVFLLPLAKESWGIGEVLKLNTTGTQYCSGFKPLSFNPKNDVDLWVSIDSETSATVYRDGGLQTEVAILDVDSAMISSNKASFSAFSGDSTNHLAAIGTFTFDKFRLIKSLQATLIRRGVTDTCYSKASITGKRIN